MREMEPGWTLKNQEAPGEETALGGETAKSHLWPPSSRAWSSPLQFTIISCVLKDGSEGSRCGWPHQESC